MDLLIIQKGSEVKKVTLHKNSLFIGRINPETKWRPDIDLSMDDRVSREHALISFIDGSWRLKDLGSKHGTLMGKREIRDEGPITLPEGVPVKLGDSFLILASTDYLWKADDQYFLGFRIVPAINYALYHCDYPIIFNFCAINTSTFNLSLTINVSISEYSGPWQNQIELKPQAYMYLQKLPVKLHYEKLEGLTGRLHADISVNVNQNNMLKKPIHILGFYEWPLEDPYRKTLACFIAPAHPTVQGIVHQGLSNLEREGIFLSPTQAPRLDTPDKSANVLEAIYNCLKEKYNIRYVTEPPSYEPNSQVIRPPHEVVSDMQNAMGQGTCIDLALLMAACLENIHLQPLIIIVKENNLNRHAFIGCWNEVETRFEPILTDFEILKNAVDKNRLILLESTGFTNRWDPKLSYSKAVEKACEAFYADSFLFAIDVAAARQTVLPLQFPFSPQAIAIIRNATDIAYQERNDTIEAKHILLALLSNDDTGDIKNILQEACPDFSGVDRMKNIKAKGADKLPPRLTINYRRIIEDARIMASDSGEKLVTQGHLFYAVLLSQSKNVDRILNDINAEREKLKKACEERFCFVKHVVQTLKN